MEAIVLNISKKMTEIANFSIQQLSDRFINWIHRDDIIGAI
jgi:hypothetical protein